MPSSQTGKELVFTMPIFQKKQKQLKPARVLVLSLLGVILGGTLLLMLPISSKAGQWTGFVECFFTATSATCVTGLSLFDTYTYFTIFGQVVIVLLIQIGGLGLITLVTSFSLALGRKMGLVKASALASDVSFSGISATKKLFLRIVRFSFSIESAGTIILMLTFVPKHGAYGIFMSFFMSVSAFCNAGFDVMGIEGENIGLANYTAAPQVLVPLSVLIFLGGIGFVVWENFSTYKTVKHFTVHTKTVLVASFILIFLGTAAYFVVERLEPEKFGHMGIAEQLLSANFASFSARTAGFTAAPIPLANEFSSFVTMVLMFIGAAPASTAGGIKVTTIAILAATIVSIIKGREDVQIFGHLILKRVVYKTIAVFNLSVLFVAASFITIYLINPQLMAMDILYEVISAFSTTGLSTGVCNNVDWFSQIVLCVAMFAGRVGPVSLILSLTLDRKNSKHQILPTSDVLIG